MQISPIQTIPDDLLFQIIKRAPLKTVGRSMCVCKSWNSLLSTPHFFKLYQQHLPENTQKSYLLSMRALACNAYASYHLEDEGNLVDPWTGFSHRSLRCFPSVRSSTLSLARNRNNPEFIDVINGIVCLITSSSEPPISIILWNPLISTYVVIPDSAEIHPIQENPSSVGFGFEASSGDFRVIRLWMPIDSGEPLVFDVFSLKNGDWRRRDVDVSILVGPSRVISASSLYLNGVIHWIVVSGIDNCSYLLMFDCQREKFKKVKLPPESEGLLRLKLFNHDGMVAITTWSYTDMWVMGECESWQTLHGDFIETRATKSVSMGSLMLINHAKAQKVENNAFSLISSQP